MYSLYLDGQKLSASHPLVLLSFTLYNPRPPQEHMLHHRGPTTNSNSLTMRAAADRFPEFSTPHPDLMTS